MTHMSQKMRYRLLDFFFFNFVLYISFQHQAMTAGDILFSFCPMELENKGGM